MTAPRPGDLVEIVTHHPADIWGGARGKVIREGEGGFLLDRISDLGWDPEVAAIKLAVIRFESWDAGSPLMAEADLCICGHVQAVRQ